MIDRLDHLRLNVPLVDAAVARYETLLGRRARGARLQLANIALAFAESDEDHGLAAMAFATSPLSDLARLLARRAIPVEQTEDRLVLSPSATHQVAIELVDGPASPSQASPATAEDAATVTALDHIVIRTPNPERAVALYAGRLGLDLRLDRSNPQWGARLLFFRCGDLVVEVSHDLRKGVSDGPDRLWGLAWRVPDIHRAHARLHAAGLDISELRDGRRPGSHVFTVRSHTENVPTLIIGGIGRWQAP